MAKETEIGDKKKVEKKGEPVTIGLTPWASLAMASLPPPTPVKRSFRGNALVAHTMGDSPPDQFDQTYPGGEMKSIFYLGNWAMPTGAIERFIVSCANSQQANSQQSTGPEWVISIHCVCFPTRIFNALSCLLAWFFVDIIVFFS